MNSINRLLNQHVERAKNSKVYQEKPVYIKPKTNTEIITKEYKKQKVDKKDHLEMEDKIKPSPTVKKASGMSTLKKQVKMDMKKDMKKDVKMAGSMAVGKPVQVKGSVPLKPVNAEDQTTFGLGKPNRMTARQNKVREIMKSKKMSLPEASKYIKQNNIKY